MAENQRSSSHVQSVERALTLLDLLANENHEMSLTEISKAINWPKSTVHGLLTTMRNYQYITQSPTTGKYWLGVRLFELGNYVARSFDIKTIAMPTLTKLNNLLGDLVQLATEDNGEVLYLEKLDSTHMIRIVSDIGIRLPMHCSGLGKVLLAYKKPSEIKWIISKKGMQKMTSRTITSADELERELAEVRARGYAIDDQEIMESLRCVAFPIRDMEGVVRYAISVSGIVNNMQGEHLSQTIDALSKAAAEISFAMGYRD
jgi:DNA-binding IclR family transcriptional regulator